METITKQQTELELTVPNSCAPLIQDWEQVVAFLPDELETMATKMGALVRRRKIRRAIDLLRIVLAYALCDWSLRLVGVWCVLRGIADVSDVALLQRLRKCAPWLGWLIVRLLQRRRLRLAQQPGLHVRIVDATTVSRPGSRGTDWRIHLSFDLERLCLDGIEVTDAHGGESLARFPSRPGEIKLADRGYAFVSSLAPDLEAGTGLLVRINWQNLPLRDANGQRLDLIGWLKRHFPSPAQGLQEAQVWLATPHGRYPLRLIAVALPPEAANRARQRAYQNAKKKGRMPSQSTLLAAGFVLLVSNLPRSEWSASELGALYRLRWQIEIHFKRLKGLLELDGLRAQDPCLTQTYLLGKLLGALLLDELIQVTARRVPDWFESLERPVSLWRLTDWLYEALRGLVRGSISLLQMIESLPRLQRFLCDSPRKRRQQLAWARRWFVRLTACRAATEGAIWDNLCLC